MEKQKSVMFGNALNGYKKQDVNAFIATLNANFAASEAGYQKQIAALKDSLAAAEAQTAALREQCRTLEEAAEAVAAPVAAPAIDEDELAELRKKAALYDRMSGQLGDIMLNANHSADLLLADARRDADDALAAARSTIAQNAALVAAQLESLYRTANNRTVGEINAAMQQTGRALNKFQEELAARRARIDELIRTTDAETRRAADEQIARLVESSSDAIAAIGAKPTVGEDNA